jgi:AraC-like DNA-binding protein
MDPLSDVLRAVRLKGAVFFDVRASEPWAAEAPPGAAIVGSLFPGSDHLMSYHVITRGGAWASLDGEPPMRLSAGDVVVFPHGDAHALSSAPGLRHPPDLSLFRRPKDRHLPFALSMNAPMADSAHIVCGFLGCDARPFNPLLSALPRVIRVSDPSSGVIGALARFASAESNEPRMGGEIVLGRLSELMFVDVVRRYLEELPTDRIGWLAGLREPSIGRALTAMHRDPARAWTLELLAREVGLSRSALAERFTQFVGQPPVQYLTNWRMQLAANELVSGLDSVAAVAGRVGYDSDAAFSRAFKKAVGESPSHWRKHRARTGGVTSADGSGQRQDGAPT